MNRLSAIRYLLAALAIVGLILAPIASPAAAMPAAMSDDASMAMPADMPCCPDQAPMPGCGKDCPFMAVCIGRRSATRRVASLRVPLVLAGVVVPGSVPGSTASQRPRRKTPQNLGSEAGSMSRAFTAALARARARG